MKAKYILLILFLIFFFKSCNTASTDKEIKEYSDNSKQLMGQWIPRISKKISIICVMPNEPIDSIPDEKKTMILQKLKITGEEHLNKQFELTHYFRLTDSLVGDLNLISLDKKKELKEQSNNGEPFFIWYLESCKGKWLNISLPIFNEDYTLAYLEISTGCVTLCGSGGKHIFKHENGKWIHINSFDHFIS